MSHPHRRFGYLALTIIQVAALLLTGVTAGAPMAQAAPAPARVAGPASAPATALDLVTVSAPDINCIFDGDCTITVKDASDTFTLPGGTGEGRLQSRLWPQGEAGTPGQDIYPYIYRIDATAVQAVTAEACVTSMEIDFGPVAPLDYNGDNEPDHVFVVTSGGLGSVGPVSVQQSGDILTFLFREPVCPGATSFFFGLASKNPPTDVQAKLEGTLSFSATLDAKAPDVPARSGRIAYVFREDRDSAGQFKTLLENNGFGVQLIPLADVLATNFADYDLAVIAKDTGYLNSWGDAAGQDTHISNSGIPVLGLEEGGYAYFGRHGMQIGWPNGWHGTDKEVRGLPGLTYYQTPFDLTGLLAAPLGLYTGDVGMVSIYMPTPIAGVTPLGWEAADNEHAPLIAEQGEQSCRQLWGFGGAPDLMTPEGARLFINAVVYGLDNCPDAAPEPEPGCYELFSPREIPAPTLIDFDDVADATELETAYLAGYGVTFGNDAVTHVISYADRDADPTKALSSPNVAINDAKFPNTSAGVPMTIRFDSGKTHVGFYMGNGENQGAPGAMVGYDAAGNVVCQVTNTPVPEEFSEFIGMYDPAGRIQIVTLDYGPTAASEAIDNLYFAPGPNPTETEYPTPEEPLVGGEHEPVVEVGAATNERFAAQVQFPEGQLWPVKVGEQEFVQFAVPGVELADGIPGQPDVPVFRRIVAVPRGAQAVINGIRPDVRDEISLLLYPVQESPMDAVPAQSAPPGEEFDPSQFMDKPFVIDEKAYAGDTKYPAEIVSVVPLGRMRDLDLVQINVATAQYHPAKQSLAVFESVDFEIVFEGGEGGFLPEAQVENEWDNAADALYAQVLNYEAVRKWPFPGEIAQPVCLGSEFIIVTDPAFRPAADTLRTWKVQKGISTVVVETGGDPGDAGATREQIRDYIQTRFDTCFVRPSYVLLLGDAEHIAPFYRLTTGGDSGTDLDYALMNPGDILPDLGLGRIPVDTLEQAQVVIDKIVGYEQNPPLYLLGGGFYNNISFAAYFQCCRDSVADDGRAVRSFIETAEFARAGLTGLGYNVDRIYTTDTAYHPEYVGRDATPRSYRNGAALPAPIAPAGGFAWDGDTADIVDAINDGRFLVFHRDHGWSGGWGDPYFDMNSLDQLNNGNKLPVIYSVNCASGYFDNETATGGNVNGLYWAEKALRMSGGGAVGIIGDTRNSPTWANSALSRGLFDATWPGIMPATGGPTTIKRLGDILNYGKIYLAGQVGVAQTAGSVSQSEANTDIVLYHVYGDPTMAMWTSNPNQIRLPDLVWEVEYNPWWWQLRYPVEGAIITLLQEGQPVGRGTVRDGMAQLDFINEFDEAKSYTLAAEMPGAVAKELKIADATGTATPADGGGVMSADGAINVRIPAGVAPEPLTLLLAQLGEPEIAISPELLLPAAAAEVNAAQHMTDVIIYRHYELLGLGASGALVSRLNGSYPTDLGYSPAALSADGLTPDDLHCLWLDEAEGAWAKVPHTVRAENAQVTCETDALGKFALVGADVQAPPVDEDFQVFLPLAVRQ